MKKFRVFQLLLIMLMLPSLVFPAMATQTSAPVGDPTIIYGAQTPDGQNPVMGSERMDISARSAILYELTSDTLVYAWNVDAQIQHEPRFADLGCSAENAQSLGDQALDTKFCRRQPFVHECFTVYDGKILMIVHLFFPFF